MSLNDYVTAEVSDPTDFPPSSSLRRLDSFLRCAVCKDFYEGPVITPCGHTFCSLCIRESLSTKQECPHCRTRVNEGQLRTNVAMEDTVSIWKQEARTELLTMLKQEQEERVASHKRKTPSSPSPDIELVATASGSSCHPAKRQKPEDSKRATNTHTNDQNTADCPVCNKPVKLDKVNQHLDSNCTKHLANVPVTSALGQWGQLMDSSKAKNKTKMDNSAEQLPKVSYDTLKDRQIKNLLSESQLSVDGDRAALIQRHQRWVMIFNANLDKGERNRSSVQELRAQLRKWEADLKAKRKKPVIPDPGVYQKTHKSDFDKLIAEAKPKKKPVPVANSVQSNSKVIELDSDL